MTHSTDGSGPQDPNQARVLTKHAKAMRRLAAALLGDEHAAQDVAQTAALRALSHPPRVLSRAWLETVVRHQVSDRRRKRSPEVGHGELDPREEPSAQEVVERLELGRMVLDAVNRLEEPYRTAVYLRYFEEHPVAEVARIQGVPRRTAQTRLYRALNQLEEDLSGHFGPGSSWADWRAALSVLALRPSTLPAPPAAGGLALAPHAGAIVLMTKKVVLLIAVVVIGLLSRSWVMTDGSSPKLGAAPDRRSPHESGLGPNAAIAEERTSRKALLEPNILQGTNSSDGNELASIQVRVVTPDGQPQDGVAILLHERRAELPMRSVGRDRSHAGGQVRFPGLPPGTYRVTCGRSNLQPQTIQLGAGVDASVTLTLQQGAHVSGKVEDHLGRPVPFASVWLTTGSNDWLGGHVVTRCDGGGRFELEHLPESQSLGALAPGHSPSKLHDLEHLDLTSPPTQLTLTLRGLGGALKGVVRGPDGAGLEGAIVAVGGPGSTLSKGLVGNRMESWTPRIVRTGPNGEYQVDGLRPGPTRVEVRPEPFAVWSGEVEVRENLTSVLDVGLSHTCRVVGTVRDVSGAPIAGASVFALDESVSKAPWVRGVIGEGGSFGLPCTTTGEDGAFVLKGLSAGATTLVARRPASSAHPRAQSLKELDLRSGEQRDWNPILDDGRVIHGRLMDSHGTPLSAVVIQLTSEAEPAAGTDPFRAIDITDNRGRFRFIQLEQEPFRLSSNLDPIKGLPAPPVVTGVFPGGPEIVLRAAYELGRAPRFGAVVGRIRDAGQRLQGDKRRVLLESDRHSWRTDAHWEEDSFRIEKVRAGKHRIVVMRGEQPVLYGDWIQVEADQVSDAGTLVTERASALQVSLVHGGGLDRCAPVLVVRPESSWQAARHKFEGAGEHRIEDLAPGTHMVHLYGEGIANDQGQVDLIPGGTATIEFELKPAVMVPLVVDWPVGSEFDSLHISVVDEHSRVRWSQPLVHGPSLDGPFQRGLPLPLGSFSLRGRIDGNDEQIVPFQVLSLTNPPPAVQLSLR